MTIIRAPGPVALGAAATDDPDARSRRLHEYLRLVDRTWVDDGSVYMLLPETSRAAADTLVTRLQTIAPELLPGDVRMAVFPDDGLTSGALISVLHGASLSEVPTPIRAAAIAEEEPVADEADAAEPINERAVR
jgi:hypothetical protein